MMINFLINFIGKNTIWKGRKPLICRHNYIISAIYSDKSQMTKFSLQVSNVRGFL